jgi:hypothetical protein
VGSKYLCKREHPKCASLFTTPLNPPVHRGKTQPFKGRDFVFGNFLTISADLKILKQPNHVKHLRIFSTIFEILKTLPLKGRLNSLPVYGEGWGGVLATYTKLGCSLCKRSIKIYFSLSPLPT